MDEGAGVILYVKTACPWCVLAEWILKGKGVSYRRVEVRSDPQAMAEMERISGQRLAPTLSFGEAVLADFGPFALLSFLKRHGLPKTV